MTDVIYLPLGYNRQGVRLAAGVWCQSHPDIAPHWQTVSTSRIAIAVHDNRIATARGVIYMLRPVSILRQQYRRIFNEDPPQHFEATDLIVAIIRQQQGNVASDIAMSIDYAGMTKAELKAELDRLGIAYPKRAKHADLLALVESHD